MTRAVVSECNMPKHARPRTNAHRAKLSAAQKGNKHSEKHGHSTRTHRSPEYMAWVNMRSRCLTESHPDFSHYGGRGITICDRWANFPTFLADVGERPGKQYSIDRIDNDGNYCPENVRWATRIQQGRNRRGSATEDQIVTVRSAGIGLTNAQLARMTGLTVDVVSGIRREKYYA